MADDIREGDPDRPRKRRPARDDDDGEDRDDRPRRRIRRDDDDGGVSTVIPYKNAPALAAYYCGVFGVISCFFVGVGGVFGIVPIILGIVGIRRAQANPQAHGTAHAWTGIILGSIELLTGCGAIGFFGFNIIKELSK